MLKGVVRPVKMSANGKALQIFANAKTMNTKCTFKLSPGLTDINTFGTFTANKVQITLSQSQLKRPCLMVQCVTVSSELNSNSGQRSCGHASNI